MDPELRSALQALDQKIDASAAETRAYVDNRIAESAAEIRADVARQIAESGAETRAYFDGVAAEVRRHAAVLVEGLRSDFRVATEMLVPVAGRVVALEQDRAETHRRLDGLEARVGRLERSGRPRPPRGRGKGR